MQTIHCAKARNFLAAAAILSASLGFAAPAFAITFTSALLNPDGKLTYLGTLGGAGTTATGINNAGQVVGSSPVTVGSGIRAHAFITGPDGVGMRDLGTLGGSSSRAFGINDAGQVVGSSDASDGTEHAFITGPNGVGMKDLGTLNMANAINDTGQVVGYSDTAGYRQLFITGPDGVGMTALGVDPGWSDAEVKGINNSGQVVGNNAGTTFITGPNGVGVTLLGSIGIGELFPSGINDGGQVAGYSWQWVGDYFHEVPFITGPNGVGVTFLNTLDGNDSYATGINDAGQVIGYFTTGDGYSHAFVTGPNGAGMTDLNSLVNLPGGNFIDHAYAINNHGQILVTVAVVPEPEIYAMLLAGLALAGFTTRLREAA